MSHFLNSRETLVMEAIDGLIGVARPGALTRLDGFPAVKVVLRSDWDRSKVALVAGGGSGHEPAHAGFVGRGMLTAAVCGDVFASPTVEAVYEAISAVTGSLGCLVIVKNYSGDRLNFGLAVERARADGLKVETVIVADDVALENFSQPRGIAGVALVEKIAGHVAECGDSLEVVAATAREAAQSVKSLGVAVTTCSIPGHPTQARLAEGRAELGLGIHGEPGFETIDLPQIAPLAKLMTERLARFAPSEGPIAMLINNLGGVPDLEMLAVTKAVAATSLGERARLIAGPTRLVTALDMKGFSISALPLKDGFAAALTSACDIPAWTAFREPGAPRAAPLKLGAAHRSDAPASDNPATRAALVAACNVLLARESELNALDATIGDGDTGSTFAGGARLILNDLDKMPLADTGALCSALSERIAKSMGGSSGVLLSIFAAAAATALAKGETWPAAFAAGVSSLQFYGGAKEGDRTMVDALAPAMRALHKGEGLVAAAKAARQGADLTAQMARAGIGRSSYLAAATLLGVPDPGAVAIADLLEAAANTV
jgi:triose/dihydroxyacetone kinase / FAD-AMP lyase (cyclizing)